MYEIFEQLLQKSGVTPYQVSKATGVSQTTLSSWKNRNSVPSITTAKKIADYFGVSVDYLLTGNAGNRKDLPPHDDSRFMYTRAEHIHGMVFEAAMNGDKKMIDLVYSIMQKEWTTEQIDLLTGYCDKLTDDQRWFVNTIIARELQK